VLSGSTLRARLQRQKRRFFRTLDAFRVFDSIFVMTAGSQGTESVSILGYNQLISRLNLGLGSAVSVLIFMLVLLIAVAFVKGFGTSVPGKEEDE
jgi:multiple sugar transport system permease protein